MFTHGPESVSGLSTVLRYLHHDEDLSDLVPGHYRRYLEQCFRIDDVPSELQEYVKQLFWGRLSPGEVLPPEPPSARVYLCAGNDMETERTIIHNELSPLLEDYCRSNYHMEFQIVDIRRGLPEYLMDDPWTRDLCLSELESCIQNSTGPCLAITLGMKYGRTVLPTHIPEEIYATIRSALWQTGKSVSLLDTWYLRDTNASPVVYVLQKNLFVKDQRVSWREHCEALTQQLYEGANSAVRLELMTEEDISELTKSLIGAEVQKGLQCENVREQCLAYIRFLTDRNKDMTSPEAMRFVDIDPLSCQIDSGAFQAVSQLCAEVIPDLLGDTESMKTTSVSWKTIAGTQQMEERQEYTKTFTCYMYNTFRRMIDRSCLRRRENCPYGLVTEVGEHWILSGELSEATQIREDVARMVQGYLIATETDQPLLLYGPKAIGKTVIAAQIARFAQASSATLFPGLQSAIVVRFCGSATGVPSLRNLLFSICQQIYVIMGKRQANVPEECEQLKSLFLSLITKAEFKGILIIILDAIDSFSPAESAHLLEWIPTRIASNVKMILTVTQEATALLNKLSRKIGSYNLLLMTPLTPDASVDIVKAWMSRSERSLTSSQWKYVKHASQQCDTPLLLRLLVRQAISWTSYDQPQPSDLPKSTQEAISLFFSQLEHKHGVLLCCKVFGYLVSADGGLSQKELIDVLSVDEEILNHPKLGRMQGRMGFPVWYIHKLLYDVGQFLRPRSNSGTPVLVWTERLLHAAAVNRYTKKASSRHSLNLTLANVFLRQWRGTHRHLPVADGVRQPESAHGDSLASMLICNTARKFNSRVSRILPKCLAMAEQCELLKSEILCNYEWIRAKLLQEPISVLFMDYSYVNDREAQLVFGALKAASKALAVDITVMGVELCGRLLPYAAKYKHIQQLIRQCDLNAQRYNPCVANCQLYNTPGGPLVADCVLSTSHSGVRWFHSSDGLLVSVPDTDNSVIELWNLSLQRQVRGVSLHAGDLYPTSRGESLCLVTNGKTISVHHTDSGEEQWSNTFERYISEFVVGEHYMAFTTKKGTGPTVLEVENGTVVHRLYHYCRSIAISADDEYLLCASDSSLFLYTLPLMERKLVLDTSEISLSLKFFTNPCKFLALSNAGRLSLHNVDPVGKTAATLRLVRDFEIQNFVFNKCESMVLVQSLHRLHVCDAVLGNVVHTLHKLPQGIFLDRSSSFTGAAFTPDSQLVVASRYTYVCAWDAQTGQPLRILLSTPSPIERLFASNRSNLAACLLADGSMKVWNMENFNEHSKLTNTITDTAVQCLALSCQMETIICCGSGDCEAKLVDMGTGEVKAVLQNREGSEIKEAFLSPDGRYAVTISSYFHPDFSLDESGDDGSSNSSTENDQPKEAILWDIKSTRKIHHALNVKNAAFSEDSAFVSFITCEPSEDDVVSYAAVTVSVSCRKEVYTELCGVTKFVCKPHLLRIKSNSDNNDDDGIVTLLISLVELRATDRSHVNPSDSGQRFESRVTVSVISKDDESRDTDILRIQNFYPQADIADQILYTTQMQGGKVLFVYSGNLDGYQYKNGNHTTLSHANAFIYDFETESICRHFEKFLSPRSTLELTTFSQTFSLVLDSNLGVFDLTTGIKLGSMTGFDPKLCDFALDGQYICALTTTRKEVVVVRTSDGVLKGRVLVHGKGTALCVGEDGRTVSVGCNDGRILIISLTLGLSDPLKEFVGKLPSRQYFDQDISLLEKDIERISSAKSGLRRLSARLDRTRLTQRRRPPSYKLLETSVSVTRNLNRLRGSQACSLQ